MSTVRENPFAPPPPLGAPPAIRGFGGFWVRTLAYLIDAAILNLVVAAVAKATGVSVLDLLEGGEVPGPINWTWNAAMLLPALYCVLFWLGSGATPGKMAFGLRVVRADTGAPITPGQAIGRFLAYFVSAVVMAIGFVWVAVDRRKQGWHDKLAGTVVVRLA